VFIDLPIARYRFTARLHSPLRLPGYAGSLLRGQFGRALRHLACLTRQPRCDACPLQSTCPYACIFEALPPAAHELQMFNAIPNAYVIEPPPLGTNELAAQQDLVFHMVVTGAARAQLALLVYAWQRALAHGLGKQRTQADLLQVEWIDAAELAHPVWSAAEPRMLEHPAVLTPPRAPAHLQALQLHIHTPLRLQRQGRPLPPEQLNARSLVAALARRIALVLEFHATQAQWGAQVPQLVQMAAALSEQRDLRWFDWIRYSSRQQQEMSLGGVLGHWTLHGPRTELQALWPWLHLGQWLHVGKNATMGMGGYSLQALN